MPAILKHAAFRIFIPPLAGLLVYGGWAFWVNMDHGQMAAWKAAMTQGGYSFTITLVLALLIEWLFNLLKSVPYRSWWVASVACLLLYSTSWGVNALTGTPNILMTILPGAVVSTIYTVFYLLTLNKIKPSL